MRKVLLYICMGLLWACKKDEKVSSDPSLRLNYSANRVDFDHVFTSVGSITKRFKVYNRNKNALIVSKIKLMGNSLSPFNININGQSASELANVKINGNDSINVFIKVTINPDKAETPFVVEDSILFAYNGQQEKIPLSALGQNAKFLKKQALSSHTTWDSKLPYVIYDDITVNPKTTLTIAAGSKILFHNNASMYIKGSLIVAGNKENPVLFASDRLEPLYEELPGQWTGIYLGPSSENSVINYGVIKNAKIGIRIDSLSKNQQPKLILANTVVKNMQASGFVGYGTDVVGYNNLFYNCGQFLFYATGGGHYDLKQNTFAAYNYYFARNSPAIFLSDYTNEKEFSALQVNLTNNIIWGVLDNELTVERKTTANSSILISYNLLKTNQADYGQYHNLINTDPLFINSAYQDFNVKKESPARKRGANLTTDNYYPVYLNKDLWGKDRAFPSTLGCYESN